MGSISVSACSFSGLIALPCVEIISPKKLYSHAQEMTCIFVQLYVFLPVHQLLSVLSSSLPSASYCTIKISSAIPNTFGRPLKISSISHWYISPTNDTLNSILVNVHLPNCHSNKVVYINFHPALGYGNLSLHLLRSYSMHLLVWAVCHWLLVLCVQALWVLGIVSWGPGKGILCQLTRALWQSSCTILLLHLSLVMLISIDLVTSLVPFWMVHVVHILHIWPVPHMASHHL